MATQKISDYAEKFSDDYMVIIGKGPTCFDYQNISKIEYPIIFINETVRLENLAFNSRQTFAFAHDVTMVNLYTKDLISTLVVPELSIPSKTKDLISIKHLKEKPNNIVTYKWSKTYDKSVFRNPKSDNHALYRDSGTIHSCIHFAWICGVQKVLLIGCGGSKRGIDERLEHQSKPALFGTYQKIRREQDKLFNYLGMSYVYLD